MMHSKLRAPFILLFVLFARCGDAQDTAVNDVRNEIRLLREQLDRMQQRLSELESREPAAPEASAPADPVKPATQTDTSTEISGFLSSRWIHTGINGPDATYQAHAVSLFLGKTYGNWSFHGEIDFDYRPELVRGSIPVGPSQGEVEMETAWVNYKHRDWLNARAGILMVPNYWRTHTYSSSTETVQAPLIYETVFPPDVAGIMIHGSKYFEENGFTYTVYAGQGREFLGTQDHSRNATGGSFIAHLPSRRFKTFDVGVHHYRDQIDQGHRAIWGFESRIERDRFAFLSEFARSRVNGRDFAHGYYLQPTMRLAGQIYGLYRYDRHRPEGDETKVERHTLGMLYRPFPAVALKLEWNWYPSEPASPARTGVAAGVSIFIR